MLTLTARGAALIADSVDSVDELELLFRDLIGSAQLEHLQWVAHDLYHALHLEDEIFAGSAAPKFAGRNTGNSRPWPGTRNIEQLACSLRRRLGSGDVAQLAELLERPARRKAT